MLLVGSNNGAVGMPAAWKILSRGGSALDAVEAACRQVENDPDDHTVGYGGYPNVLGDVELDASIMDGTTRRAGAVGALRGYRAAICVARQIMERLPHVLLVGDGAARFAAEIGLDSEDLLTEHARQAYDEGIAGRLPAEYRDRDGAITTELLDAVRLAIDPEFVTGTVNFLAQDVDGRIASAVSTSGWAWKYPGRIGDTAVIGAGNYADDRYGAAACMGWGELAIRTSTAHSIVAGMERGQPVLDASLIALADVISLDDLPARPVLHAVAIDAHGHHTGVTTSSRRHYLAWEDGWSSYATVDCEIAS